MIGSGYLRARAVNWPTSPSKTVHVPPPHKLVGSLYGYVKVCTRSSRTHRKMCPPLFDFKACFPCMHRRERHGHTLFQRQWSVLGKASEPPKPLPVVQPERSDSDQQLQLPMIHQNQRQLVMVSNAQRLLLIGNQKLCYWVIGPLGRSMNP